MNANLLSKEEALQLIAVNGFRMENMRDALQQIAVTAIGYANIHGDITIAREAIKVLTKGVNKGKFIAYLCAFGQFEKESKYGVQYLKREDVLKDPAELFVKLASVTWFNYSAAKKQVVELNCHEEIRAFLGRLQKRADKLDASSVEGITTLQAINKLLVGIDAVELPTLRAA